MDATAAMKLNLGEPSSAKSGPATSNSRSYRIATQDRNHGSRAMGEGRAAVARAHRSRREGFRT